MSHVILLLGLILFLAYLFLAVFDRTRVPDVLLLILVGVALGPHVTGMATPADFGKAGPAMSTVALIVVLLLGGIELDLSALRRALRPTLVLTLTTFGLTTAVVAAVGVWGLGLDWFMAVTMGTILGGTSSAVVIPLVRALALPEFPATVLTLESALTDVLTVVLATALMQAAAGRGGSDLNAVRLIGSIAVSLIMATVVGAIGGIVWLTALRLGSRSEDAIIATLAFAFIVYGVAEGAGFNGGIAVLAFGLTLSNRVRMGLEKVPFLQDLRLGRLGRREHAANRQAQFLLKVFFFVYLGISIPFRDWRLAALAVEMVAVIYIMRHSLVGLALDRRRLAWSETAALCALVPKGLAAAVLAGQPRLLGLRGGETVEAFAFMVVFVSIAATALMISASRLALVQQFYQQTPRVS